MCAVSVVAVAKVHIPINPGPIAIAYPMPCPALVEREPDAGVQTKAARPHARREGQGNHTDHCRGTAPLGARRSLAQPPLVAPLV